MKPNWRIQPFAVIPSLPEGLEPLMEIASNIWWYWDGPATKLLRRIDRDLWTTSNRNPVAVLNQVPQERLIALVQDDAFMNSLSRVYQRFQEYRQEKRWFQRQPIADDKRVMVAYFSAEYGLAECLPIYSGGLGILSGDHVKSASDLGLPFVGIGLFYRRGYFRQYLSADGWQQEFYPELNVVSMPMLPVSANDGERLVIQIPIGDRHIAAKVWKISVGRATVYLMDTDVDGNDQHDREITAQLYSGDIHMRIKQEIVLGMGGVILLKQLGIEPTVYHMNEGHSAFLSLERLRGFVNDDGLSVDEGLQACASNSVFTTHTPVPAGNDQFPANVIADYFEHYMRDLGIARERFLELGQSHSNKQFSMTVLALKIASYANGVSKLHGTVSRKMWQSVWPEHPHFEVPIDHITNGIHHRTWISPELSNLFERYLGTKWLQDASNPDSWKRVEQIPNGELWKIHERQRGRLVAFTRRRLATQLKRRGANAAEIKVAEDVLDPDGLTIGFARRFATYKRGTLVFDDLERLTRILCNPERPVQLLFAGKAHPQDQEGKELIKQIVHFATSERFRHRVVFLEDYEMNVARHMVQGVDVWLNTPRRPMEASGTSGMKATLNGGLNISILDGWWDEGYQQGVGWAIGSGEEYDDSDYQDAIESSAIYNLLENEVVPIFFDRGRDGLPHRWIEMMKAAIVNHAPFFNTDRMVMDYSRNFYFKAHTNWTSSSDNNFQNAKTLANWKAKVRHHWHNVRIVDQALQNHETARVGDKLTVSVTVQLGDLSPQDVAVQLYAGILDPQGEIPSGRIIDMSFNTSIEHNTAHYTGEITCRSGGMHGFATRVVPKHILMTNDFETTLIKWY